MEIILLVFWIVAIPLLLGKLILKKNINGLQMKDVFESYSLGIVFFFALFELITVPITFLYGSLTLVINFWTVSVLLLLLAAGLYRFLGKKQEDRSRALYKIKINCWGWSTLGLIIYQVIYVLFHMHIDNDDAWYVGTALTSYTTDTINRISPYTGEWMSAFPSDYTLSPYPIFYAMLGKLTWIHPTVLMHTIMPIILIPLSYMTYYLVVNELCDGNKKQIQIMMFFIALFNLFGNFSIRSSSAFLLLRIWQGKAVLCNIMIPLTIYFFIKSVETGKRNWFLLFMCVIAGTMVSSMGVFLLPILLAVMSLVTAIQYKKIKQMFYSAVCVLPCVIEFGIFYFVLR